ncbi:hypothetical protein [Synechocystis sp. PCC 7509]|uniref:hypothetical protein n=1 Tax=Synechocystis sp. PCC 7509 TaxID=927677 RepID=UPI0011DD10FF|nr:hypothetical protein [Synechocystis sp. PCC 7509]
MTYKQVKKLKAEEFKRLSGVHYQTFNQMVEIVKKVYCSRKITGRPSKLKVEDQVLMTLEYLRKALRGEYPPGRLYENTELFFI